MEILSPVLAIIFLLGWCFNVEMTAQSTRYRTMNTARLKASPKKQPYHHPTKYLYAPKPISTSHSVRRPNPASY